MNPLAAVYNKLIDDDNITDYLGTWKNDFAIVSVFPIPHDLKGMFITLRDGSSDQRDFSGIKTIIQNIEIGIYDDNDESISDVQIVANKIFKLFHRQSFETNEFSAYSSWCSYPSRSESENGFQGYTLECRVFCKEYES
jgi:hypothetical protein